MGIRSRKERLAVSKQNGTINTMLIKMRTSSGTFLQIGSFQGALLQIMIGSKVYYRMIKRKFMVVLLQSPFHPSEKVAQDFGFGSQSLLLQQQQKAPICPALRIRELVQKTKWFSNPMKFELGRNLESFQTGLLRAKKRVMRSMVTKFLYIWCIEVIQLTSLVSSSVVVMLMKFTMPKYWVMSTICLQVFLLSQRIQSICDRSLMAKAALQTASLLLIPMPTSASLMAMRSFAPSPTIPTFTEHSPNILFQYVPFFILVAIISLCLLTISALFSGVILAKTFTLLCRKLSGLFLMKSLSMAKTQVASQLLKLNLSICLWLSAISPVANLSNSVTSTLCPLNLAPSKTITFIPVEIMPVMRAVCTPRKILSPVIILVLISLSVKA